MQAGLLCGAAQSDGFQPRTRADASAAPVTPEGAAALVAARLLGAKCVREAMSIASAALQTLRAAAAAAAAATWGTATEDAGPAGGAAAAADKAGAGVQQSRPSSGVDSVVVDDRDTSGAVADVSVAHRGKRQRREGQDVAHPRPAAAAGPKAGLPAADLDDAGFASSDEYLGDVSEVSMSDDDGNDTLAQRRKRAALLSAPGPRTELEGAAPVQMLTAAGGPGGAGDDGAQGRAKDAVPGSDFPAVQEGHRQSAALGKHDDRPAKRQKKAKPVQKPKNR